MENEQELKDVLAQNYGEAEKILKDKDKVEQLLEDVETKLKELPALGEQLAVVPVLIRMVKDIVNREYDCAPTGTIIAIVSALLYFISPFDLIPDALPIIGLADDAMLIAFCYKMIKQDVDAYKQWVSENKR